MSFQFNCKFQNADHASRVIAAHSNFMEESLGLTLFDIEMLTRRIQRTTSNVEVDRHRPSYVSIEMDFPDQPHLQCSEWSTDCNVSPRVMHLAIDSLMTITAARIFTSLDRQRNNP